MKRFLALALLVLCVTAEEVLARGGGGCLEAGTGILTPAGEVPIEQLRRGDAVMGVRAGHRIRTTVADVFRVESDVFIELTAGGRTLRLTPEHPVATAPGCFLSAGSLQIPATVLSIGKSEIQILGLATKQNVQFPDTTQDILSVFEMRGSSLSAVRRVTAARPAYNLLVAEGGVYFANGVLVHNKGCFLPDTAILRADGTSVQLQAVQPGDRVRAFDAANRLVTATVAEIITHEVNEYLVLTTGQASVRVTREHPFYVGGGGFKTVEALRVGDEVFLCDGAGLQPQRILCLTRIHEPVRVFNLRTDAPHTFFANAFAVHNKGGGGGGHSSSFHSSYTSRHSSLSHSSSLAHAATYSTQSTNAFTNAHIAAYAALAQNGTNAAPGATAAFGFFGGPADLLPTLLGSVLFLVSNPVVVVLLLIVIAVLSRHRRKAEDLDFVYASGQVAPKADQTRKLLAFLARQDAAMQPEKLEAAARATFLKLQECWQAREYGPMQPLMMRDLYLNHCNQLASLKRNHEINLIADLKVARVEIVNLRYTNQPDQREFTALITASAKDYYVDDRTQQFLRGDAAAALFQEFWTLHRQGDAWLLREIEQTRESNALKQDNFVEQITGAQLRQIYGDTADAAGPAGPWLDKPVETKTTQTERMLNFLVQTDKLWDQPAMQERARQVFTEVKLAEESGDVDPVRADLFPDVAAHLGQQLAEQKQRGSTPEYRNLCVRKVELILVRNYTDNTKDEFTARLSAHAQQFVRCADGSEMARDDYVVPFVEFWTFGRLDNQWKLKEVLPSAAGARALAAENVDQDSNAAQLHWYYTKPRAS